MNVWKAFYTGDFLHYCGVTYTLCFLLLATLLFVYVLDTRLRSARHLPFPTEPWGLPIVGHIPFLGKNPVDAIAKYRQKYGDIFSLRIGSQKTVVLNGIHVIRKALIGHSDAFAGRPKLYTFTVFSEKIGGNSLAFSDYSPAWKVQHRIAANAMRSFASYKHNPVEEIILEESSRLTDFLLKQNGCPIDPHGETALAAGSVIYQILFGRHSNIREDKNYLKMIENMADFVQFMGTGNPADVLPWTRFVFRKTMNKFHQITGIFADVYREQIQRHLQTFDAIDVRDVSDAIILASKGLTPEERELGLSTEWILPVINDLLGAGSETVGTSLTWSLLFLATHPDVQAKVHTEIDKHIGSSRAPTYDDRTAMPYVEATLLEVFRKGTTAPLGSPHATTCDIDFMGYHIPKGTGVTTNYASTCTDASFWGDPENFRPERFICGQRIDSSKADMMFTFGAGRRRCIGEFLAKVEFFVFFTSIFQRCAFKTVPGEIYDFGSNFGITLQPKPFKVIVEPKCV